MLPTTDALIPAYTVAGGIICYDVTEHLPRNAPWPSSPPEHVEALFVHHSGKLGAPGFDGIYNSARFATNDDWGLGWAGFAYQWWIPHARVTNEAGQLVMFQGNRLDVRSWHTGGPANVSGRAVALQGNTSSDGLSAFQAEVLEGFLPWAVRHFGLTHGQVLGHCESEPWGGTGKPSCPGVDAMGWLRRWRGEDGSDRMAP